MSIIASATEAKLLDGAELARSIRATIGVGVAQLKERHNGFAPSLAVIQVGGREDLSLYIRMKKKVVESVGMNFQLISLAEAVTEAELLNEIFCLNEDPSVHGILVQMPLPKHIDERNIADSLKPEKDVDAFHSLNVAKLVKNENPTFISCIPKGCI